MKTERRAIDTKSYALEHADRLLAWDYCYMKIRGAVLGDVEEASLETISERTGHDERWAYKMINQMVRRIREES